MATKQSQGFSSWTEVTVWVATNGWIYYHAPLDIHPRRVRALLIDQGGHTFVRVLPDRSGVDPFHADIGHLSRFRKGR